MLKTESTAKQNKDKSKIEILDKDEEPSNPDNCICDRSSNSGSTCSIPVLQNNRTFRQQESIVNSRQTSLFQVPIVGNNSNIPYQFNNSCIYQSQNLFFPVPDYYRPVNPQAVIIHTNQTYQHKLYSTYFHRTENRTPSRNEDSRVTIEDAGSHNSVGYVESLRKWQDMSKMQTPTKPGTQFTVMCYNVLAQDLIREHPNLYKYHNQNALKWKVRWNNLLREINELDPDILCLQEVQESHLTNQFNALEALGYDVIYKQRTGYKIDGCAIYYKKAKFRLVDHTTVEYYQNNVNVLNRDNVAIIAKFAPHGKQTEFVVSTTHLLYNPRRQDVRLAQVQLLLAEMDRMACHKTNGSHNSYLPTIITGDFNSKFDSVLYEFLVRGVLQYEHLTSRSLVKSNASTAAGKVLIPPHLNITDNCQHAALTKSRRKTPDISLADTLQLINLQHSERQHTNSQKSDYSDGLFSTGTLTHNFHLKSVYSHRCRNDVEATTYQDEWITVDYIFYSSQNKREGDVEGKLKLLSRYRLPVSSELTGIRIPNSTLGSDHLALVGRFFLED